MKKGPLVGITVLAWTQWQMGPVATAMLGDLGADVIHIEHHTTGDPSRGLVTPDYIDLPHGRHSYFEINNRGKRGITVNLPSNEGREVIYRLVKKADVFVHNYRPSIPEKLKVDYETLRQFNPKLIYAAASGFGEKGPDAGEGALDLVGLARSGVSTLLGSESDPALPHYGGLVDQIGGIITAYGILAALVARDRSGVGQKVGTSLLMSMITLQALMIGKEFYLHKPTVQQKRHSARNPLWNYYKCRDGKWLALAMLQSQRYWPDVCQSLGLEQMIDDPRFNSAPAREKNCQEAIALFDKAFITKSAAEWSPILRSRDIIVTQVKGLSDLAADPQVIANNYFIEKTHEVVGPVKVVGLPIALSETPGEINPEAPEFGQHTEEVLMELGGYTWDEITDLREKKAI
jgi:CoA:oxalate CoA-transferase